MAVDDLHPDYARSILAWKKSRDFTCGQQEVHSEGTLYLPRLTGQSDEDYDAYVMRATLFNAAQRTVDLLSGLIFRKNPTIESPDKFGVFLNDATLGGVSMRSYSEMVVDEVIKVGRGGTLVDFPESDPDVETIADSEENNRRPFFRFYKAEDIINWRTETCNEETVVSRVILQECVTVEGDDEFDVDVINQLRVLDLVDGKYRVRLFTDNTKAERISKKDKIGVSGGNFTQEGDDVFPVMNGQAMTSIPFVFHGPKDTTPKVDKSPIIDLVHMNHSHYMTTADFEHGAHFTGLPVVVISGVDNETGSDWHIGSSKAWVFASPDAKASYLEFEGKGLDTLSGSLKDKEQRMGVLGARLLTEEKRAAETAEATSVKKQSENSVLASMTETISESLTKAANIALRWMGIEEEIVYKLNQDFLGLPMPPQMLKELVIAVQGGKLSNQEVFELFKRGELIAPDKSFEDHIDEIDNDTVDLAGVTSE